VPIFVQFYAPGRSLNSGKSAVHGMTYGKTRITPVNLSHVLFQMQVLSPRDAASGLASGKRQHEPLVIVKETDSSSPLLLQHCHSGQVLSSLQLNLSQDGRAGSGGKEDIFSTITLTNGAIVNYKTFHGLQGSALNHPRSGSESTHTNELESFELTFQKITWTWNDGGINATDDWLA